LHITVWLNSVASKYGVQRLKHVEIMSKETEVENTQGNGDLAVVIRSTLEQKEATYKAACEWFETEYDSNSNEDKVAEQEKVCYGLNEQIKLLRFLLSEYCA